MTSEAPERIWVYAPDNPEKIVGCDPMGYAADVDGDEYFLRSYALALVAEAYEAAATRINEVSHMATASGNFTQASALANEAENIRALTPADALAAREARDKQVREEALREGYRHLSSRSPEETTEPEYERGIAVGYRLAMLDLIALIEGDTDE